MPIRRKSTSVRSEEHSPPDVPENPVNSDDSHVSRTLISALKPNLPKLTLPKFKGKVIRSHSFWDSYNSTIFNYVKVLLEGPAAQSIQGLALSADNFRLLWEYCKRTLARLNRSFLLTWTIYLNCLYVLEINQVSFN